jgi:aspartate carbamoyltransferase regulatory subunit
MYDLDESDPAVAAELEQIRQRGLLAIRSGTRIDHVREFVAEAVQRTRRKVLSVGEMRELQRHAETLAMSMRVHNDKRVAEIVEEAKDVGLKAQQAGRIGDALAAGRSHIDEALTKVAV